MKPLISPSRTRQALSPLMAAVMMMMTAHFCCAWTGVPHHPTAGWSLLSRRSLSSSSPPLHLNPLLHTLSKKQLLFMEKSFSEPGQPQRASSSSTTSLGWKRGVLRRFHTISNMESGVSALPVLSAGAAGPGKLGPWVKRIHSPVTYLALAALAGFRWEWCFRSPIYWFAVGFCIKWYRARYVFKIPVWDRQPNWNNIITDKSQEKDLKAFTCKNCGSTIFIAKTREFFFEGNTGIGGLGCFHCGARGPENFVMDRERIVEDVADIDDYFEYERPLDFVSRAERRKLLQQTQGDEDKANEILIQRQQQQQQQQEAQTTPPIEAESTEKVIDVSPEPEVVADTSERKDKDDDQDEGADDSHLTRAISAPPVPTPLEPEPPRASPAVATPPMAEKRVASPPASPPSDQGVKAPSLVGGSLGSPAKNSNKKGADEDLDALGMDDF